LAGADGSIATPSPVEMWWAGEWRPLGVTAISLYYHGLGVGEDFGFFDAGMIAIRDGALCGWVAKLQPRPMVAVPSSPDAALEWLGLEVAGIGARSNVPHRARVAAVLVETVGGEPLLADVVVQADDHAPLTEEGDSGMLWVDASGRAAAIHALGERTEPSGASRISVGIFAERVARRFGVTLVA
jgi:hypothetical protein